MSKWPKKLLPLTREEEEVRDKFIKLWHEVLPQKYGLVERFNHHYPLLSKRRKGERVIEIGAGIGAHLSYEEPDWAKYVCVELRPEMAAVIKENYPNVEVIIGDCQEELPVEDHSFDRALAIHVLEHLPNLPGALDEIGRVLKPKGLLSVCIPCEAGFAYSLARKVSAQRVFRNYFPGLDYDQLIVAHEHINGPEEIFHELSSRFEIIHKRYFPLLLPSINLNLVIGITLTSQIK
ncbi:MAG: class I SAM-dependent methyltransferase [Thermodesulfobacteriota bacterium]|jgi:SAM-dependent methyltransferase